MHGLADEASRMRGHRVPRSRSDEYLEVGKQFARALVAVGGILLQQLSDDAGGGGRKVWIDGNEWFGLDVANSLEHQQGRFGVERQLPGRHLIENDTEGEEVAAFVGGLAARLLRRQI